MPLPQFDETVFHFPDTEANFSDEWDDALNLLKGAEQNGVLDAPYRPLSRKKKFTAQENLLEPVPDVTQINSLRFETCQEHLWLLGYLPEKTSKASQKTQRIRAAIRKFQRDSNLIVDGWIGDQTWKALNELVSFETPIAPGDWLQEDGNYRRSFLRAVSLRLWAYGLANARPLQEFTGISAVSISRLKKALWSIRLLPDYTANTDRNHLYSILLDADKLVKAVADSAKPRASEPGTFTFQDHRLEKEEHKELKPLKRRFIANLAKTELWLLGSEISIDSQDDYPVLGLPDKKIRKNFPGGRFRKVVVRDEDVQKHLLQYWADLLVSDSDEAAKLGRKITPEFFQSLVDPEKFSQAPNSEFNELDYSKEIAEQFENGDTRSMIDNSFDTLKKLGMKLWDGLKRLWRWIKKGVRKIADFMRNAYRAFFRFALKAYKIVRTAFTALARSMEQYIQGYINFEKNSQVRILIEKDLDFRVCFSDSSTTSERLQSIEETERFSAMFRFSFFLIAFFVNSLKKLALGFAGWYRLLMTLVKGYKDLVPVYKQMMQVIESTA